jgi:cytochrome c oxidase subunit 1
MESTIDTDTAGQFTLACLFFVDRLIFFGPNLNLRTWRAKGVMSPDLYNIFGAMHGTIMVFLAIVPLAFGAFGNYVVPIADRRAGHGVPALNMASYLVYFLGGVVMLASFFIPGGAAQSGWTSYSPAGDVGDQPPTVKPIWLVGMVLLITSSLLGAVNFIATIIQLRAPGMTWMRLPFFTWAQFVTGFSCCWRFRRWKPRRSCS